MSPAFTREVLEFFDELLGMVSLRAADDNFEKRAGEVIAAKQQLATALAAPSEKESNP